MRYIRAVHCGRVSPKEFKFQLGVEGSPLPLAEFIQTHVLNASDRHTTLISGDASSPAGVLTAGVWPVRTDVTVILPRGKESNDAV